FRTLRAATNSTEFVQSFNGRILALGRVHRMLTSSSWRGAYLSTLIREQLTYEDGDVSGRILCSGPSILIEPQAAIDLGLVLHDLNTNAPKPGPLSRQEGRLTFTWFITGNSIRSELRLRWTESNGPAVVRPARSRFGITFIERSLGDALGGKAE